MADEIIELTVLEYLKSVLDVPVYMEVPADMPASFIVVQKLGSGKENHIYSSSFALQSYAESTYKAAMLNAFVIETMESMISLGRIISVKLNSDYIYTDTSNKKPRYQCVFDIRHY